MQSICKRPELLSNHYGKVDVVFITEQIKLPICFLILEQNRNRRSTILSLCLLLSSPFILLRMNTITKFNYNEAPLLVSVKNLDDHTPIVEEYLDAPNGVMAVTDAVADTEYHPAVGACC